MSNTPSLTVRSLAEMMRLPAYEQARLLGEQKHPKRGAAPYRRPYYGQALTTIQRYYRSDRSPAVLAERARAIRASRAQPHRKEHNLRVITQFSASDQAQRPLVPVPRPVDLRRQVGGVTLRLRFDLVAAEGDQGRYLFYHFKREGLDEETARTTLEIAHWMIGDPAIHPAQLEFVDITRGKAWAFRRPRKSTLAHMRSNLGIIETLWPSL